jgi:hypothetical protein
MEGRKKGECRRCGKPVTGHYRDCAPKEGETMSACQIISKNKRGRKSGLMHRAVRPVRQTKAVTCLKCDNVFRGSKTNRICPKCTQGNKQYLDCSRIRQYRMIVTA